MKAALISPNEPVFDYSNPPVQIGERIAEVADVEFPVAPPLFWVECNDDVVADQWYWDGTNCVKKPEPPVVVIEPDAQTTGTGGPDIVA